MKNFKIFTVVMVVAWVVAVASTSYGGEHDLMPPAKTNKSFEQLKQLVGTWKGTTKKGDKEEDFTVKYELTSGGNALMERLFEGTPHEMISIYYPEGKTVAMTHYCMLGNQPKMTLKSSTNDSMNFVMKGISGIHSANEMHMHGMNLKWIDKEHVTTEWTSFAKGKKSETAVFTFAKK